MTRSIDRLRARSSSRRSWSPTAPATSTVASPAALPTTDLADTIQAAAATVLAQWTPRLADSVDAAEITTAMAWLVARVDDDAEAGEAPAVRLSLTRFLLGQLEATLIGRLEQDERLDRSDTLRIMQRIANARRKLEPDWQRFFASQIEGPDGLDLVSEVLHDLRSPLTSIRCLSEILERGQSGPVTDAQRRQLRVIYSASLHLGTLANDVLEMARHGEQLVDAEPVPFSIDEVFAGIEGMVRPMAEEKGLYLRHESLPGDVRVGRPVALARVLLNLVTNALKFTERGGVELRARCTSLTRVRFTVTDSGPGIPAAAMDMLFQPFRRRPDRSGRSDFMFSSTGLGLALCRRLTAAMGATLELSTSSDTGTSFSFELELPRQPSL